MVWNPGKYRHVPVEDIRASSITYEQLVMRCFDRLGMILSDSTKEESYRPIESNIRFIDSLLAPYWSEDENYKEKRQEITEKFDKPTEGYEYFKLLMVWVKLMTTKFSEMDILPVKKGSVLAGVGPAEEHSEYFK